MTELPSLKLAVDMLKWMEIKPQIYTGHFWHLDFNDGDKISKH